MIIIDGSLGEGGGQIFRTSLTLAMCLGKTIRIENIRAGRKKPGLLRQHLTCLKAAKEICDADVEGEELGSQAVVFKPGKIKAGKYHFAVGTAGSSTLIFQTILMPLLLADDQSEVILEGGTHNSMAPTFDFVSKSFLPVLKSVGCDIDVALEHYGFYPAGGGKWQAVIKPIASIKPLLLLERGELLGESATAMSSKIPKHVGERELRQITKLCGWSVDQLQQELVGSVGPGNVVSIVVATKNVTALFENFGEKNVSAEKVANKAVDAFQRFDEAQVPVCEYLADQLILPMALGRGGVFRTLEPSLHLRTNIDVIKQVMNVDIQLSRLNDLVWEVVVNKSV